MDRSRRTRAPKRGAAALAQLAELRGGGGGGDGDGAAPARGRRRQLDAYEVKEEAPVYDVVDEDEYADLVAKRRREGGGFVVDDDGAGYVDMGEEVEWGEDGPPDAARDARGAGAGARPGSAGASKKGKAKSKKHAPPPLPAAQRARIDRMFASAAPSSKSGGAASASGAGGPATGSPSAAAAADADAALDDILGELGGGPAAAPAAAAPRAGRAAPAAARRAAAAAPRAAAVRAASRLAAADAVASAAAMEVDDGGEGAADENAAPTPAPAPASAAKPPLHPATARVMADDVAAAAAVTPTGAGARPAPATTPYRTPPVAVAAAADEDTPAAGTLASGWEELVGGEGGAAAASAAPAADADAAAAPSLADGAPLPLDGAGALPFFMLDAHEEPGDRGTLYLFGKVPLSPGAAAAGGGGGGGARGGGARPRFASACAVLTDLTRSILFVPRPGVLDGPDVARLEADAAANPAARGALLAALHEKAADLKTEVRALLQGAGVSRFALKPVKRAYPGVGAPPGVALAKGEQWCLKARVPAAAPPLPAGTAGTHFAATFGGAQSTLEAFLLKRGVKGAVWLSLAGVARVPERASVSWCALEVTARGWKGVAVAPDDGREPPPLTVAAVKVTTALHAQAKANEVVALSVVTLPALPIHRPVPRAEWSTPASGMAAFTIVRRLEGAPFPPGFDAAVARAAAGALGGASGPALAGLPSEKALLGAGLARLKALDADVIVGHNAAAFDLDVLLHRALALKVPHWSRLGRLKRSRAPRPGDCRPPPGGGGASPALASALAGRLLCDTYLAARDMVKDVDYTLTTMARALLGQARSDLPPAAVAAAFESADGLLALARHAQGDAWLALGVATHLSALPLTRALACLSGSLWSRALLGQRAGRIEMLLLHELHGRKMLMPDRWTARDRDRLAHVAAGGAGDAPAAPKQKGPQYAGGLVLEPKKGLYDAPVLLLDFNSLYPSIIQEYNLCFTTVAAPPDGGPAPLPPPSDTPAVLPTVIKGLVQRRRAVKDMLRGERDPTRRAQLDIRQTALKLTANSMYGCLGFTASRFYAKPLAELVTATGREVLSSTVDLVTGSIGADVVYGDTDSIMVATGAPDLDAALALAGRIKREVNKRYRALEIELDGVYARMLLLKKKKYAALKLEPGAVGPDGAPATTREAKGLDIVRRDWCPLAKDAGNRALDAILGGGARDDVVATIHDALRDVASKVAAGAVPLHKFVITKALTKRPSEYGDADAQPHVQVALRRAAAGAADGARVGETVPYVVCVDGPDVAPDSPASINGGSLAARARHPDEVRAGNGALVPDAAYYLGHQVHPVVARLCAPIDGTHPGALAECLGLDGAKFRGSGGGGGGGSGGAADLAAAARDAALLGGGPWLDDDARFAECPPLVLPGAAGGAAFPGAEAIAAGEVDAGAALATPTGAPITAAALANAARLACRAVYGAYYDAGAVPDDDLAARGAGGATRDVSARAVAGGAPGGAPADPAAAHRMLRALSEADAYARLAAVWRALDPDRAVAAAERKAAAAAQRGGAPPAVAGAAAERVAPVRDVLAAGADAAAELRDAAAFRWVDVGSLFVC